MANTKDIKKRIKSIKTIEKITSAMKMIATARLKKYQSIAEHARPYAEKLQQIMFSLSAGSAQINHPLFSVREENSSLYIVVGAEGGLAGSYNVNVMNMAMRSINNRKNEKINVIPVGKKAVSFFKKKSFEIVDSLLDYGISPTYDDIEKIVEKARIMFENNEIDAVYLVYAKFISAMSQKPTVNKILPMEPVQAGVVDVSRMSADVIFEPNSDEILKVLLPEYLNTVVYHSVMEAMASEFGARMTAMTAASTNAETLLEDLSLAYNKARQATITNELIDIVNGVNAVQ